MFVAYETKKRKIGYKNDELKISAPRQNEKKKKNLNCQMIHRLHYQIFTDISNK